MGKTRFLATETLRDDGLHFVHASAASYRFAPTLEEEVQALRELELREWGDEPLYTEMHVIHGERLTLNYTLFPNLSLMGNGVDTGFQSHLVPYATPLITNHDQLTVENTLGRSYQAAYVMDTVDPISGVIAVVYEVTDRVAKERILSGQYMTTSIGARTDRMDCTICGINWLGEDWADCEHERGIVYDGKTCGLAIGTYWNKENSFVTVPADTRAGVRKQNVMIGLGQERYALNHQLVERLQRKVFAIDGLADLQNSAEPQADAKTEIQEVVRAATLPLAPKERAWDGGGAKTRMLSRMRFQGGGYSPDAGKGFCAIVGDGSKAEHYKLPFADVLDGTLKCVYSGCVAAKQRLPQTQGLSESQKKTILSFLDGQLARFPQTKEAAAMDEDDVTQDVIDSNVEGTPEATTSENETPSADGSLARLEELLDKFSGLVEGLVTVLTPREDAEASTEETAAEAEDDSVATDTTESENGAEALATMIRDIVREELAKLTSTEETSEEGETTQAEADPVDPGVAEGFMAANSLAGKSLAPEEVNPTDAGDGTTDVAEAAPVRRRIPGVPSGALGKR